MNEEKIEIESAEVKDKKRLQMRHYLVVLTNEQNHIVSIVASKLSKSSAERIVATAKDKSNLSVIRLVSDKE